MFAKSGKGPASETASPSTSGVTLMFDRRICLLFVFLNVLVSGCEKPTTAQPEQETKKLTVLKVWKCPPDQPYWREDGEGPFPPSWPTTAVLCQSRTQADNPGSIVSSASLFLLAGHEFEQEPTIESLAADTQYVTGASTDSDGRWVTLAKKSEQDFFVLVGPSGGTASIEVTIYKHNVSYNDEFQGHGFGLVFLGASRIIPLLVDVDDDSFFEVLIGSEETNSSGAPGTPQIYRILKWDEEAKEIRDIGQVAEAEATRKWADKLIELRPDWLKDEPC